MFGYRLSVPLTLSQVDHRRDRLDQAGFHAWLTPVLLLQAIWAVRWFSRKGSVNNGTLKSPNAIQIQYRRVVWLLGQPLSTDFGTLDVHIIGLLYLVWLLYLAAHDTAPDYMHLTKALSHVAVSQLPLHYLLAIKSPNSPIQLATGLSHERLNSYHRLLGRIIHVLFASHAIMYLNYFVQVGVISRRIQHNDVRLGIAAFWTANFLVVLALPVVRRRAYHKLFYRSHAILSGILLLLLWFHVPYTRSYIAQASIFWFMNGVTRTFDSTASYGAKVQRYDGTELLSLTLPVSGSSGLSNFLPGEHVYIKPEGAPLGPKTPFTVVGVSPHASRDNLGNAISDLSLVVKDLDGPQSGWLRRCAEASQQVNVLVEGPYGEARQYMPIILNPKLVSSSIMLVCGGVGANYGLPIYLTLLLQQRSDLSLRFIWVVRSFQDAEWGIEMLAASPNELDAEIYITGQDSGPPYPQFAGISKTKPGLVIKAVGRRPDLHAILKKTFSPSVSGIAQSLSTGDTSSARSSTGFVDRNFEPVTVLSCAPPGLTRTLRYEVGKHVMGYGRQVHWHEEQFGLGSS